VSREVEADTEPFGQEMTFLALEHTSDQADDLSFSRCSERPSRCSTTADWPRGQVTVTTSKRTREG
jgi:hypothetical protein